MNIKHFQKQYGLANKDMAEICQCSLPTIQKWRSGEVNPAGPARQLMRLLDHSAGGDPAKFRQVLSSMNQWVGTQPPETLEDLGKLENSMTEVVDRIELMLEGRRKERQLAESEARYRSMVEGSRNPVCRWLPDTTLTYVNDAYRDFFHPGGGELVGRQWIDFVPEEKRSSLLAIVSDIARRGEADMVVHESVGLDGRLVVHEWHDIPIKNERGEVVELHSVGYDITEVVELRTEVEELGNVRRSLMSLCAHPIVLFTLSGEFIEVNTRFQNEILQDSGWKRLDEMVSDLTTRQLERLLKHLTIADEVLYKARIGEADWHLQIRFLKSSRGEAHYLAVLNPVEAATDIDGDSRVYLANPEAATGVRAQEGHALRNAIVSVARENHLERAFVCSIDTKSGAMAPLLTWCHEGSAAGSDEGEPLSIEALPWVYKRASRGQLIQIDDITRLPRTARAEQEVFLASGLRSLLLLPLQEDGEVIALVGFGQSTRPRLWQQQEVSALKDFRENLKGLLPSASAPASVPAACIE
ncbi:MAG TPA: PAS domain-containing protein [Oceanipulchritudo sp.]|nr:PAS domain-containing protein [Oceanipulchritudo sp.]